MSGGNETKDICTKTEWGQSRRKTVFLTLTVIALNDCSVMKMFAGGTSPEGLNCAHRCMDVEQLFSGHCLAVWPAAFLFYTMFSWYCLAQERCT